MNKAPMPSSGTRAIVVADLGRAVRWIFFIATAVMIGNLFLATTFPAFNTPIAELTISAIGRDIGASVLFLVAGAVWVRWAFASGEKEYGAWFGLGVVGIIVAITIVYARAR